MTQEKTYEFKVTLRGQGKTIDEAWEHATECFCEDTGDYEESYEITERD